MKGITFVVIALVTAQALAQFGTTARSDADKKVDGKNIYVLCLGGMFELKNHAVNYAKNINDVETYKKVIFVSQFVKYICYHHLIQQVIVAKNPVPIPKACDDALKSVVDVSNQIEVAIKEKNFGSAMKLFFGTLIDKMEEKINQMDAVRTACGLDKVTSFVPPNKK